MARKHHRPIHRDMAGHKHRKQGKSAAWQIVACQPTSVVSAGAKLLCGFTLYIFASSVRAQQHCHAQMQTCATGFPMHAYMFSCCGFACVQKHTVRMRLHVEYATDPQIDTKLVQFNIGVGEAARCFLRYKARAEPYRGSKGC